MLAFFSIRRFATPLRPFREAEIKAESPDKRFKTAKQRGTVSHRERNTSATALSHQTQKKDSMKPKAQLERTA
jgi:hypothetical protein